MRKNKILFLCLTLLISLSIQAKEPIPQWAINEPKTPQNANYVYVSGMGIGYNETDAISKAWDDALKKSMSRGGLLEYSNGGVEILRNRIARKVKCQTPAISIENSQIKVYVLFQIPKRASDIVDDSSQDLNCMDKEFEQALKVWNYGEYPFSPRALVPGMAQLYKGSGTKGILFIAGEVVCVGGIVACEGLRASYNSKINTTHDANEKQNYINNADNMQNLRNGFIAGAALVYVWNVIDGIVAKGKSHIVIQKDKRLSIAPYIAPQARSMAGGISLAFNF